MHCRTIPHGVGDGTSNWESALDYILHGREEEEGCRPNARECMVIGGERCSEVSKIEWRKRISGVDWGRSQTHANTLRGSSSRSQNESLRAHAG